MERSLRWSCCRGRKWYEKWREMSKMIICVQKSATGVDFDATTGELILAEEEIEYSNGDVEWKSFN